MFKESAFIRKNTPELREYLEKLGYKLSDYFTDVGECLFTTTRISNIPHYGTIYNSEAERYMKASEGVLGGRIDCKENEDFFKAVVALANHTDYMQWFTNGIEWFQWKRDTFVDDATLVMDNYHKADIFELEKHFNL